MLKIDIICISKAKNGAFFDLISGYERRMQWKLNIIELESKHNDPQKSQEDEITKISKHINPNAILIAMDERGKDMRSLDFAKKLEDYKNSGDNHIQFVIGGADGLTQEIRKKANIILSFGKPTWPHLLARVMLLEQIYRAQQIIAGHPYHRE